MRGGALGPAREEARLPRGRVVAHGDRVDEGPRDPRAVERVAGGMRGDAREEPASLPREVRHARGAVVGHDAAAVREVERARGRQAGVAAREDVHAGVAERALEPAAVAGIVQRFLREAPPGERRRVAVHDAHAGLTHARDEVHGQRGERIAHAGKAPGRLAKPRQDRVGPVDVRVAHVDRVGAAAARPRLLAGDLRLHVAADRGVPERFLRNAPEIVRVDVEPVEVAVEGERHRLRLPRGHGRDLLQRLDVAIEAANHVERPRLEIGCAVEHARRVAVSRGTAASRRKLQRHQASAPPQEEPWPAVQP